MFRGKINQKGKYKQQKDVLGKQNFPIWKFIFIFLHIKME